MLSPVGSKQPLERVELEEGLVAYRCPETGGHWIPAPNYWKWQQSRPPAVEDGAVENGGQLTSEFDDELKLCPESQTFMSRYRVGHGLNFRVERSVTGGVWLDGGDHQINIDLQEYDTGLYLIQVRDGSYLWNQKLVKVIH